MVLDPVGIPKTPKEPSTLDDFLKPVQTYSRFYFSATDLVKEEFGLTASKHYPEILKALENGLASGKYISSDGNSFSRLNEALEYVDEGGAIVVIRNDKPVKPFPALLLTESFRDKIDELTTILNPGHLVLFKVKAHHGFDLHLFCKQNIYRDFFYQFKPMIAKDFRFFSINGKRAKSERLFYFETWSLARPPHGFEEVFEDTAYY